MFTLDLAPLYSLQTQILNADQLRSASTKQLRSLAQHQAWEFDLERLPYSLFTAKIAVENLIKAQQDLRTEANRDDKVNQKTVWVLLAEQRYPMLVAIHSFLESARRTQDALGRYISAALKIPLSASMADIVKKIEQEAISLPKDLSHLILSYWHYSGRQLKDYRDLALHYAVVGSNSYLFLAETGETVIYFLLPNNPEIKNVSKLTYGSPPIHAYEYVATRFFDLYELVYRACYMLSQSLGPAQGRSYSPGLRSPLSSDLCGLPIPTIENWHQSIESLATDLKKELPFLERREASSI